MPSKSTGIYDKLILGIFYNWFSIFRLDTTQVLLENGADPFARSRYGDDALQTACLKGSHQIFDYLKQNVAYSSERLANAHELIGKRVINSRLVQFFNTQSFFLGSTFLDEHNETRVAVLHWRMAHHIRLKDSTYISKLTIVYNMNINFNRFIPFRLITICRIDFYRDNFYKAIARYFEQTIYFKKNHVFAVNNK